MSDYLYAVLFVKKRWIIFNLLSAASPLVSVVPEMGGCTHSHTQLGSPPTQYPDKSHTLTHAVSLQAGGVKVQHTDTFQAKVWLQFTLPVAPI